MQPNSLNEAAAALNLILLRMCGISPGEFSTTQEIVADILEQHQFLLDKANQRDALVKAFNQIMGEP